MQGPVDSERRLDEPDGSLLEGRGATLTDYIVEGRGGEGDEGRRSICGGTSGGRRGPRTL